MTSRRNFLVTGSSAAMAGGLLTDTAKAEEKMKLEKGDVILFQGDSITDAARDKKRQLPNDGGSLGRGYPHHIAGGLLRDYPSLRLLIYNRGISGNKVPNLDSRWDVDALELKPDILSILVGVNDIWHKLNGNYDGTPEVYKEGFTALLERTKTALPDTKLVICEPFVLRCGAVNDTWFPEFEVRRKYAKEVSDAAGAIWVPFQEMFDEAVAAGTKPEYWAHDGVHPSVAGHALMAKTWRDVVGV